MFDLLTTTHKATCKNCDGPIHFAFGALSSGSWYHDQSGMKACPGTPTAFPIDSSILEVDLRNPPGQVDLP